MRSSVAILLSEVNSAFRQRSPTRASPSTPTEAAKADMQSLESLKQCIRTARDKIQEEDTAIEGSSTTEKQLISALQASHLKFQKLSKLEKEVAEVEHVLRVEKRALKDTLCEIDTELSEVSETLSIESSTVTYLSALTEIYGCLSDTEELVEKKPLEAVSKIVRADSILQTTLSEWKDISDQYIEDPQPPRSSSKTSVGNGDAIATEAPNHADSTTSDTSDLSILEDIYDLLSLRVSAALHTVLEGVTALVEKSIGVDIGERTLKFRVVALEDCWKALYELGEEEFDTHVENVWRDCIYPLLVEVFESIREKGIKVKITSLVPGKRTRSKSSTSADSETHSLTFSHSNSECIDISAGKTAAILHSFEVFSYFLETLSGIIPSVVVERMFCKERVLKFIRERIMREREMEEISMAAMRDCTELLAPFVKRCDGALKSTFLTETFVSQWTLTYLRVQRSAFIRSVAGILVKAISASYATSLASSSQLSSLSARLQSLSPQTLSTMFSTTPNFAQNSGENSEHRSKTKETVHSVSESAKSAKLSKLDQSADYEGVLKVPKRISGIAVDIVVALLDSCDTWTDMLTTVASNNYTISIPTPYSEEIVQYIHSLLGDVACLVVDMWLQAVLESPQKTKDPRLGFLIFSDIKAISSIISKLSVKIQRVSTSTRRTSTRSKKGGKRDRDSEKERERERDQPTVSMWMYGEKLMKSAETILFAQLRVMQQQLDEFLFLELWMDTHRPGREEVLSDSVEALLLKISAFARIFVEVLSPNEVHEFLCSILMEHICDRIAENIVSMRELAMEETEILRRILRQVIDSLMETSSSLPKISLSPSTNSTSSAKADGVRTYIPSLAKLQMIESILGGTLSDCNLLLQTGVLFSTFSLKEIRSLVKSVWNESKNREEFLKSVEEAYEEIRM